MTIFYIILFLLFLSLLVVIHELGHFLTAKAFGVYCHEFSVGMGKLVYQKQVGETKFSLRALPIGGYVMMAGESEIPGAPELPPERTLVGVKKWKKAIILSAGVILNFVLGYVFLLGFIANTGVMQELSYVNIAENSILDLAGLETGDRITAMTITLLDTDGTTVISTHTDTSISSYQEILDLLEDGVPTAVNQVQCLTVTVEGKGVIDSICRTITEYSTNDQGVLLSLSPKFGISATTRDVSLGESLILAWDGEWEIASMILSGFVSLFSPDGLSNVSGPIGMVEASFEFINMGFWYYLYYWALISINLGVFNLIPIPGLDGARLIFTAVEGVTRRKVNPKFEMTVHALGYLFLLSLMILITFKDLLSFF